MDPEVIGAIIGAFATLGGIVLAFYLANRLALNDSMDSKFGWRKELMDIASKDEITLADIYRIRASVRYYPHLKPTQLSFRWMTNLIIKLCDEHFVEVYKDKKAGTNNGGQNIIIIQSAINSSRQFRRRLTNSTVAVLPENDEIVPLPSEISLGSSAKNEDFQKGPRFNEHLDKVMAKDVKITTFGESKAVIENVHVICNSYCDWGPLLVILVMIMVILLILCIFYICCSRKCCCKKSSCQMCCCNKCCDSNCCPGSKKQESSKKD